MTALHFEDTERGSVTGRPSWLNLDPEPVYAVLYTPAEGVRAWFAALILPTFGWENECPCRARRAWAIAFAQAGVTTIRFDFPGTEDSTGSPVRPARFQTWIDATTDIAHWLRHKSKCDRLVLVGVGLGAIVGYRSVAGGAPIDNLILWAARASGRAYMREQQAFAVVATGRQPDERDVSRPDGIVGFAGHRMSAETVSALASVDLTATALPAASLRRVLLIGRDASGVDTRLHDHMEQSGVDLTVMQADDDRLLVMVPDMGLTPSATIERSVDWWMRDSGRLINEPGQVERALGPAGATIPPAAMIPEAVSEVEFESHGVRIRERLLDVEFGSGQLFAVLAEPVDGARPPFCLVSVNAASLRHTGPSRVMVELARRAAATGLATVRLDLPGLGDSDGSAPKALERNDADNIGSVAALGALYDQLEASGIVERFVSLGVCLGAYVAALAALADQRSVGAIAVNPQFAGGRREVRRQRRWAHSLGALDASSADKGSTRVTAVLKPALQRARKLNNQLQAALGPRLARRRLFQRLLLFWPDRTVCRLLRQLGASGTRVLLVCSSGERLMRDIEISGPRSKELARWPNLMLAPLATDSHLLYPLWSQDECVELVLSYLDEIRGVTAKEDHGGASRPRLRRRPIALGGNT